jgi:hypothetical protein
MKGTPPSHRPEGMACAEEDIDLGCRPARERV